MRVNDSHKGSVTQPAGSESPLSQTLAPGCPLGCPYEFINVSQLSVHWFPRFIYFFLSAPVP